MSHGFQDVRLSAVCAGLPGTLSRFGDGLAITPPCRQVRQVRQVRQQAADLLLDLRALLAKRRGHPCRLDRRH